MTRTLLALTLLAAAPAAAQLDVQLDAKLTPQPVIENGTYGFAVARDGDRMVVGSPALLAAGGTGGWVFVYDRIAGTWTEQARLVPVASSFTVGFGSSVGVDGDTVVAVSRTANGRFRAHVYENDAFGSETTVLLANEGPTIINAPEPSVAISGDVIAVGSPAAGSIAGPDTGAVYVYERPAGGSFVNAVETKLSPSGGAVPNDWIGSSIDTDGQIVVAGTPFARNVFTGEQTGKVFVWERNGTGWVRTALLVSVDPEDSDRFGESVSLDGNRLAVGVALEDGFGAVEIWSRNPDATWSFVQRVQPGALDPASFFGRSVDLVGGRLAVGAPREGIGYCGAAYLFAEVGGQFVEQERIVPDDAFVNMWFGTSVNASASEMLVGAARDWSGKPRAGSMYAFTVRGTLP